MTRMTAKDFDQGLPKLDNNVANGKITKRAFLTKAGKYAVGGVSAMALLNTMSPNFALAHQVSFTDPNIIPKYITYSSPNGTGDVRAYFVRPSRPKGPVPAVLVVHENRGLNPYIEDVARRLAKAGFMALAPDGLSSVGGYPGNDADGRVLQQSVDRTLMTNDFYAGYDYLKSQPEGNGKVGAVGFRYGATVVGALAAAYPRLNAAVMFYGRHPRASEVPKIQAPLMIHLAEEDEGITSAWPEFEAELQKNNKLYQAYIYEGVNHSFHNDSTSRYDEVMAEMAWGRTTSWFKAYLATEED